MCKYKIYTRCLLDKYGRRSDFNILQLYVIIESLMPNEIDFFVSFFRNLTMDTSGLCSTILFF